MINRLSFRRPLFAAVAIVISGGVSPLSNHGRYYVNIDRVARQFGSWKISNLVADGPDSTAPNSVESSYSGSMSFDSQGLPRMSRLDPKNNYAGPATLQAISQTLKEQVRFLKPGDPLLIYMTDHGSVGSGPENRVTELWGEKLGVSELRNLIRPLAEKNPVILINDQCYGGGMLEAIWDNGTPIPNICGFASASPNQVALNGGGMMKSIDAVCKSKNILESCTFGEVYNYIKTSGDWHRDSTPISSGDLFLQKVAQKTPTLLKDLKRQKLNPDCNLKFSFNAFSKIEELVNSSLALVLKNHFTRIERDLSSNCRALQREGFLKNGCDKKVTADLISEIKKTKNEEEAKFTSLLAARKESAKKLGEMIHDWLVLDQPKLYRRYTETKEQIDALMLRVAAGDDSVQDQLSQNQKAFKTAKMEFDLRFKTITGAVKADPNATLMQRFLSFHAKKSRGKNPGKEALDAYKREGKAIRAQRGRLQPLFKFYGDLTTISTLTALIRSNDVPTLSQYLNLVSCENQRIQIQ